MCPKCGEILPDSLISGTRRGTHPEDALLGLGKGALSADRPGARGLAAQLVSGLSTARNLGLFLVALGLASLLIRFLPMCFLPDFVAYAALPLSGIGLLVGLIGIVRFGLLRQRDVLYVVAGTAICTLALGVFILIRPAPPEPSPPSAGTEDDSLYRLRSKELK
jgi:hypothetical protein